MIWTVILNRNESIPLLNTLRMLMDFGRKNCTDIKFTFICIFCLCYTLHPPVQWNSKSCWKSWRDLKKKKKRERCDKCLSVARVCLLNFKRLCQSEILATLAVLFLWWWEATIYSFLFTGSLGLWNQRQRSFSCSRSLNLTSVCEKWRE